MTKKEFFLIGTQLQKTFPEFIAFKDLLLLNPLGDILRGIAFQGSGWDKHSFCAWQFVFPLWKLVEKGGDISMSFGSEPLGLNKCERCFDKRVPDFEQELIFLIKEQALPFLNSIQTNEDFLNNLDPKYLDTDPYDKEAQAYARIRIEDFPGALKALDELIGMLDFRLEWEYPIAERARLLKEKILRDPAEAQAQLEAWKEETIRNLKLDKLYGLPPMSEK
jgi:hypothetical protein